MTPMLDALVVGAGPAGSHVAIQLARAGRDVVLVEREKQPVDKVCGEFLSHEAVHYLAACGVDLDALGAVPITAVRFIERSVQAEIALPFEARSLSRRLLDEAMLARATEEGVQVLRGRRVNALGPTTSGFTARLADATHLESQAAFLATGKHDLRGHARTGGLQNDLVAFKMHYVLAKAQTCAIERHVELVLFDGGYAGLQPIEHGYANLCLVVRRSRFESLGYRFERLLTTMLAESPHLRRRLEYAEACWEKPLALSSIPYGYVQRYSDGVFQLGDQAAVIPSFAGDGIAIALHSARLAAETFLAGGSATAFQQRLARDVGPQVMLATALSQALVRSPTQRGLALLARRFPAIISSVAFRTRIPASALRRNGMLEASA
jgi:flavin-dependent dehydrogenase